MAKKAAYPQVDRIISVIESGHKQDVVILFVPSHDDQNRPLSAQDAWADAAMNLFGELYRGATAFQTFAGIYVTDDGDVLRDKPIMVESYVSREDLIDRARLTQLVEFMKRMGRETKQASVAVVINDAFHEVKDF